MTPISVELLLECCDRVNDLYVTFDRWAGQGRPIQEKFQVTFGENLVWAKASSFLRRPGPRDRYYWVDEWSPLVNLVRRGSTLFVVVRGTSTEHEWSNNYRFFPRSFMFAGPSGFTTCGSVHDGFLDIFESMEEELLRKLDAVLTNPLLTVDRVVITGHSLGAAVATLIYAVFQVRFSQLTPRTIGLVFGSPRVGTTNFASAFNGLGNSDSFWRYELMHDRVVELPPAYMGPFRFRHVGHTMLLDKKFGSDRENHVIASYRQAISETHPKK